MRKHLVARLRAKADEIDRTVSRDKGERDTGVFGEIELMQEAADEIESLSSKNDEIGRLRGMLQGVVEGIVQAREPHWSADQKQAFLNGIADAARAALKE